MIRYGGDCYRPTQADTRVGSGEVESYASVGKDSRSRVTFTMSLGSEGTSRTPRRRRCRTIFQQRVRPTQSDLETRRGVPRRRLTLESSDRSGGRTECHSSWSPPPSVPELQWETDPIPVPTRRRRSSTRPGRKKP